MNPIVGDIALIFLFIIIGGVFAAAEMALVTLRESQIKQLATRGKRGQRVAELTANPNRFLSAVQIGVTLAGFLSAAFGGATLSAGFAETLVAWGVPTGASQPLALVLITMVISYFSIVLGELTAKRLAMQRAESFALALAPLVNAIAVLTRPVIWFLGKSTDVVVQVLGGDPAASREEVSDEELRVMVGNSQTLGDTERQILEEVFAAGEVSLREAMIPRTEVDFLDGSLPAHKALREIENYSHSRYPVVGRHLDDVLGFVHIRDLALLDPAERNTPVAQLVRPVASLPQSVKILQALGQMRTNQQHLVIVRDEYGGTAGIVTIEDLVEELVGEITDEFETTPLVADTLTDQTEVDGLMTLEDFAGQYGYQLPEGPYDTVAGYLMAQLGRLPTLGDSCVVELLGMGEELTTQRFEINVIELDGRRAARLQLRRVDDPAVSSEP